MLFLNKILIIIIVCVASSSYAADYYISDISGDDLNDGSSQNPWKSISKLSTHSFQSGDQIFFERGNFASYDNAAETSLLRPSVLNFSALSAS